LEWFASVGTPFAAVVIVDPLSKADVRAQVTLEGGENGEVRKSVTIVSFKATMFAHARLWPFENSLAAVDLFSASKSLDALLEPGPVVIWALTHDRALWFARMLAVRRRASATVAEIRGNYDLLHELHRSTFFLWTTGKSRVLSSLAWGLSKPFLKAGLRHADVIVGRNINNLTHALSWIERRDQQYSELIRIEVPSALGTFGNSEAVVDDEIRKGPGTMSASLETREMADSREVFSVIFASRLSPEKWPEDVIAAWAQSKSSRKGGRLAILGGGPLEAKCKRLAKNLGVEGSIDFRGSVAVDSVLFETKGAHLGIETYGGSSLVEKALLGCPVVAYDIEWHSELVQDGETGVLVPFRDIEALARSIDWCRENPIETDRMARLMQRRARDMFDQRVRRNLEQRVATFAIKLASLRQFCQLAEVKD
jgi:glycosyltransferase involved in cell wall biosynthesis